jgi:hypothetical protein
MILTDSKIKGKIKIMNNQTTNTIEIKDAPEGVQVNIETKSAPKAKAKKTTDADKINLLEKAAKKAGNDLTVTIAPKSKKSTPKKAEPKANTLKKDAPKTSAEPEKIDLSKVAPLTVPKELLDSKIAALDKKLAKDKLTVTKNAFHVAYGYFLAKAKSGKVLTIEYHETLKPAKWLVRDDKGKVLTAEAVATLWKAHETAINL